MQYHKKRGVPLSFTFTNMKCYESVQKILETKETKSHVVNMLGEIAHSDFNRELTETILSYPKVVVEPDILYNTNKNRIDKALNDFKTIDTLRLPFPRITIIGGEKHSDSQQAAKVGYVKDEHNAAGKANIRNTEVDMIKPYFISESDTGITTTVLCGTDDKKEFRLFRLNFILDKEKGISVAPADSNDFGLEMAWLEDIFITTLLTVHKMTLDKGDFYMSIPSGKDTRVNRNRLAKGKKPLMEFKITKVTGSRTNTDPDAPRGTHASPRQHLRRGHWRTLPKTGKKVWVSSSQVGNELNGRIIKTYAVGRVQ